jgi:hypothetical protein
MSACKAYAEKNGKWVVPKKDTPEYAAIKKIQDELKGSAAKAPEAAPKVAASAKAPKAPKAAKAPAVAGGGITTVEETAPAENFKPVAKKAPKAAAPKVEAEAKPAEEVKRPRKAMKAAPKDVPAGPVTVHFQ